MHWQLVFSNSVSPKSKNLENSDESKWRSPAQWRVGSFPRFHCVPGTAARARVEGPSASPPAGWRSNLQPETNAKTAQVRTENIHSIHSVQLNCVHVPKPGLRVCRELQQWRQAVPAIGLVSGWRCHTWRQPGRERTQVMWAVSRLVGPTIGTDEQAVFFYSLFCWWFFLEMSKWNDILSSVKKKN